MNILLTIIGLLILALLIIICLIFVAFLRKISYFVEEYDNIKAEFTKFITPVAQDKPSPAGELMGAIGYNLGRAAAMEIKTTLMGQKSGVSRAVDGAIIDEASNSVGNPLLGGLLGSMGKPGKKSLLNNPLAQSLIQNFLSRGSGAGNPGAMSNENHDNGHSQAKFRL